MIKTNKRTISILAIALGILTCMSGCSSTSAGKKQEPAQSTFATALDTQKEVSLEISGFLGNFEALDSVINDFNEYYPNVTITYEENERASLAEYLKNNDYVDIFMTSDSNIRNTSDAAEYAYNYCLDLSTEDIETDAIDPELIKACSVDGHLVRIPLAKMMCGMVVNRSLLAKEGLSMPKNYEEFLSVCRALKDKGYTPIQSATNHAYSDMILPMAMCTLGSSKELTEKVVSGDTSYADSLNVVYNRLNEIISNGYTDYETNSAYPADNYDGSILRFFEGDVPFWIANSENFSGMKKRESKSEAFTANPFEYEFVNVPLGDNGVYDYEEPWYGFSINRNSQELDYAVEFIRFLITEKELNSLAQIKGVPSAAINTDDSRYLTALHPDNAEARFVLNGTITSFVTAPIANAANQMGKGTLSDTAAAVEFIKEQ